jgi:hypothetical protein
MKLPVLFLALLAVPALAVAASVDATVKSVSGSVTAAPAGTTNFAKISVGQKLPAGTTIKTGAGSEAIIVATPGAACRIDENTTVTVDNMQFTKADSGGITRRKATLDLQSGTVSSLIDHSTPDVTDFVVKTPQGSAAARGTFYGVTVKNGQTFYKVQEGKVGVAANKPADKKKSEGGSTAPASIPAPPLPTSQGAKPVT